MPKGTNDKGGNVRVCCRFRPQNKREKKEKGKICIKVSDGITVDLRLNDDEHSEATRFNFDRVFDTDSAQEEVYEYSASTLVAESLEGYNCTIFAYGQTGSGKTHSMMGEMDDESMRGIIPRIVEDIFVAIQESPPDVEFTVKAAYVEIYLEKIRDLIDPSATNLRVREDKTRGVYVDGVTECYTGCPEEMFELMERGASNRAVSSTAMNAESSRSHSLFIITIGQQDPKGKKSGQLFLVDLAGSEMIGKTGASGQTLKEAQMINKSLSALGNVIKALVDQSSHVPYRDSKLTFILQDSLGGNSKTSLIITASCSSFNAIETLSTLRFGDRAKSIQNKAKRNVEMSVAEYKALLAKADKRVEQQISFIETLEIELEELRKLPGAADVVVPTARRPLQLQSESASANPPSNQMEEGGSSALEALATSAEAEAVSPKAQRRPSGLGAYEKLVCDFEQKFATQEDQIQEQQSEAERLAEDLEEREGQLEEMTATITSLCDQIESMGEEIQKVSEENEEMRKEKNDALEELKESSRKMFEQQELALEQEERALANRRSSEGHLNVLSLGLGSIGESEGGAGGEFMEAFKKRLAGTLSEDADDMPTGSADAADGGGGGGGGGAVDGGNAAAGDDASAADAATGEVTPATIATEGKEGEAEAAATTSADAALDTAAEVKTEGGGGAKEGGAKAEAKGGIQLGESQAVDTFTDSESDTERAEVGGGDAAKSTGAQKWHEKQRLAKIQQFLEQDLGRMNAQFVEMKEKLLVQTEQMEVLATSDDTGLKSEIMKQQGMIGEQAGQLKQSVEELEQTTQHNSLLESKLKNRDEHIKNLEVALAETQKMYRSIQSSQEVQQQMGAAAAAGVVAHSAATTVTAQLPVPPQRRDSGSQMQQEGGVFVPSGWGSASSTPESRFVQNAKIRKPIIGGRMRRGRASSKEATEGGGGRLRILRQSSSVVMERATNIAQSPSTTAAMAKMRSAMSVVSAFSRKTTATVSNVIKTPRDRRSSLGFDDSTGIGVTGGQDGKGGFEQTRFELTTQQSGDGWESGKVFIPEPKALPAAELKDRLVKFYREHNEAKVEIVDQVVDCYLDDQVDLNSELRKTYGVDMHTANKAAIKVMRQDSDELEEMEEGYDSEDVEEDIEEDGQ
jgi:hypothetical protein